MSEPLTTDPKNQPRKMWAVVERSNPTRAVAVFTRRVEAKENLCGSHEKVVRVEVRVL